MHEANNARRRFLTGAAALGAASFFELRGGRLRLWPGLPSASAAVGAAVDGGASAAANPFAPPPEARFFVVIRTQGNAGMDVTLGLDPWLKPTRPPETDIFIEYGDQDVLRKGAMAFGPSAVGLAPHAGDCAVVNGILVSENDNGHDAAMMYMSTGNGAGKSPDLIGELALSAPAGPYGVLASSGAYSADRNFPVSRIGDLTVALDSPDPASAVAKLLEGPNPTPLQKAEGDVVAAGPVTAALLDTLRHWRNGTEIPDDEHVVAAAFLSGAARQAQILIRASVNLDTHSGHVGNHLRGQKSVWDRVATIFTLFKSLPYGLSGASLFDHTTFYVYSEFSRTPALDAAGGKNHNPLTNSALLAGRGIRGGTTIGSSLLIGAAQSPFGGSYHMAAPLIWETGLPATSRQGATFIFPENVIRTCASAAGADPVQFRSIEADVKALPMVLKV